MLDANAPLQDAMAIVRHDQGPNIVVVNFESGVSCYLPYGLVQRPRRYGKTADEILRAVGRDPNARQKNKIPNYRNGEQ